MSRVDKMFGEERVERPDSVNEEGYPAYSKTDKEEYLQMVMTNTLGNTYYVNEYDLLDRAEEKHNYMREEDPKFMARVLSYARNKGYMRIQPIFGLAKLMEVNSKLFKKAFKDVVRIPSDAFELMTIIKSMGHGTGGRAVKKAIRNFLNSSLNEYWAIKYNGRGRNFNLTDLIRITHPVPIDKKKDALFNYLVTEGEGDKWKEYDLPKIHAYEELKVKVKENRGEDGKLKYSNEILNLIRKGRLNYNVITSVLGYMEEDMMRAVWEVLLDDMPLFAMLRHLDTLDRNGIFDNKENVEFVKSELGNAEAVRYAKILPFRFAKAYDAISNNEIRDILRIAVDNAVDNIPEIPGDSAIFLDVSASMEPGWRSNENYLEKGGLLGFSLYKKSNAIFWTFDTQVYDPKPSKVDSVLTQAKNVDTRGGTDTGAPIRKLRSENCKVDNIIMITDEQQNTGSSFYKEIKQYRKYINRKVKVFIIDVSPYNGGMVPELDNQSWYIYGWSDRILKFIPMVINGFDGMVKCIEDNWELR